MPDSLNAKINTFLLLPFKFHFGICQQKGCWRHGDDVTECFLPDYEVDDEGFRLSGKPDFYYCYEHAGNQGFCICCGEFWGGIESFEFEHPGYCDNCHYDMERDFHASFDYEDDYDDDESL